MKHVICCFALVCEKCEAILVEKEKRVAVKPSGEPLLSECKKVFRKKEYQIESCSECGHEVLAPTYYYNDIN